MNACALDCRRELCIKDLGSGMGGRHEGSEAERDVQRRSRPGAKQIKQWTSIYTPDHNPTEGTGGKEEESRVVPLNTAVFTFMWRVGPDRGQHGTREGRERRKRRTELPFVRRRVGGTKHSSRRRQQSMHTHANTMASYQQRGGGEERCHRGSVHCSKKTGCTKIRLTLVLLSSHCLVVVFSIV